MLCDSASVREGLLHVLGGGITDVSLSMLPAPLQVTFAFRAVLDTRELREQHRLGIHLLDSTEEHTHARLEVAFQTDGDPTGAEVALSLPVPLSGFIAPRPGQYLIRGWLDQQALPTLPLRVTGPIAAVEEVDSEPELE